MSVYVLYPYSPTAESGETWNPRKSPGKAAAPSLKFSLEGTQEVTVFVGEAVSRPQKLVLPSTVHSCRWERTSLATSCISQPPLQLDWFHDQFLRVAGNS